jgi:mono/diheme cytochrome c family protein
VRVLHLTSLGVVVVALLPLFALAADDALVAEGARWWRTSGDPANPIGCATCHHDLSEARAWAVSFPKFRPQFPPHARVMTLLQANAEAVRIHYFHDDPLPAATAITAFVARLGAGQPRTPGVAPGQPVFPARLDALARSADRGRALWASRCAACHTGSAVARAADEFPRRRAGRAESLEAFLERHAGLGWDSPETADLLAYLANLLHEIETSTPPQEVRQ